MGHLKLYSPGLDGPPQVVFPWPEWATSSCIPLAWMGHLKLYSPGLDGPPHVVFPWSGWATNFHNVTTWLLLTCKCSYSDTMFTSVCELLPTASEEWGKAMFSVCSHPGVPTLAGVPTLGGGVPTLAGEGTYLGQGRYLPWLGGFLLWMGVPIWGGDRGPTLARGVPTLMGEGGYLPWPGVPQCR